MSHQQVQKDLNIEQLSNEYRTWYEWGTNEVRRMFDYRIRKQMYRAL